MQVAELIKQSQKDHRVDVIDLASRLGLSVYAVDMDDDTNGCIKYQKDTDSFYIMVNSKHPTTRQRFTIAHEIGHYLKHADKIRKKGQLDRGVEFTGPAEIKSEAEADQQAAEILMPEATLIEYLKQNNWGKKTRFNAEMIGEIADHFRVSRAMAVTRLRELKLPVPYLSFA